MTKKPKKQSKKAELKKSLIHTLDLALQVYPDIKDLLRKDMTTEKMANDLLSSLGELDAETIRDLSGKGKLGKLRKLKALRKLKKLKI